MISNHNIIGNIHDKRSENMGCNTRPFCDNLDAIVSQLNTFTVACRVAVQWLDLPKAAMWRVPESTWISFGKGI